jgi:hypothetical protein
MERTMQNLTKPGRFALIGALIWFAATGSAQSQASSEAPATVTVREAQTLPLRELARLVLGAAGGIVVDVDRPQWGPEPGPPLRLPPGTWPPAGPPPMSELVFYGQPRFVGTYKGLCGAERITVHFDDESKGAPDAGLAVTAIQADTRFGVEGSMEGPYPSIDVHDALCREAKTSRDYFPAPDVGAAWDIAQYLHVISREAQASAALPFVVACGPEAFGVCADQRRFLKSVALADIDTAKTVTCPKTTPKNASCYELTMREPGRHINRMTFLTWRVLVVGSTYMNQPKVFSLELTPEIAIS